MRKPVEKKLLHKHVLYANGYIDDSTSNFHKRPQKILLSLCNIHLVEEEKQNPPQKNKEIN